MDAGPDAGLTVPTRDPPPPLCTPSPSEGLTHYTGQMARGGGAIFQTASCSASLVQAINSCRTGTVSCLLFCFQGREQCPAYSGPSTNVYVGIRAWMNRAAHRMPEPGSWNTGPITAQGTATVFSAFP